MNISVADASRLARFLAKGIFENPTNKDVNIAIGDNTQIGIERRGHKYSLYIQYNQLINKSDVVGGFNENIALNVLAEHIKTLIEQSTTIKNVVLNMEKVPLLPEEAMKPSAAMNRQLVEQAEAVPDIQEATEDASPVASKLPDTASAETAHNATMPLSSSAAVSGANNIVQLTGSSDDLPDKASDSVSDQEEDDSIYEQLGGQPVIPDDSEPQRDDENELEGLIMDNSTVIGNTSQKIEVSTGVRGIMPTKVDTKNLPEMSYLANVIGDEAEIKQKLTKAVEQLVTRDKYSAVEFYIKMLYRMLPLFNNDVSSAATGTGLDQRDFMLSVFEQPIFSKFMAENK